MNIEESKASIIEASNNFASENEKNKTTPTLLINEKQINQSTTPSASTPTLSPSPSSSLSSLNHTPIIPTISPSSYNNENTNRIIGSFSVMDYLPSNSLMNFRSH